MFGEFAKLGESLHAGIGAAECIGEPLLQFRAEVFERSGKAVAGACKLSARFCLLREAFIELALRVFDVADNLLQALHLLAGILAGGDGRKRTADRLESLRQHTAQAFFALAQKTDRLVK